MRLSGKLVLKEDVLTAFKPLVNKALNISPEGQKPIEIFS